MARFPDGYGFTARRGGGQAWVCALLPLLLFACFRWPTLRSYPLRYYNSYIGAQYARLESGLADWQRWLAGCWSAAAFLSQILSIFPYTLFSLSFFLSDTPLPVFARNTEVTVCTLPCAPSSCIDYVREWRWEANRGIRKHTDVGDDT